jgi:hypothetical protein
VKVSVEAAGALADAGRLVQVQARARMQQVDHQQAQQQRDGRGADEPAHGLGADPADGGGVLHVGDAGHQGGEDQRRDDHLDQPQEQVGAHLEPLDRLGGLGRVEVLVAGPADQDPEDHGRDDQIGEALVHAVSSGAGQA